MLYFCSECSDMVSNIFTYDRNVVCFETRNCVCHDVSFYYIIWSKALLGVRIDRRWRSEEVKMNKTKAQPTKKYGQSTQRHLMHTDT